MPAYAQHIYSVLDIWRTCAQLSCNLCRTNLHRACGEHKVHRFHGFTYIWSFHTRFIKQAFGESYHHNHLRAHPFLNLYLDIQSTIMNVDLVQTLSLFSLDMIQKTYCKPNEQLFSMGDHAIATYVIKHIEGENSTKMTPKQATQ